MMEAPAGATYSEDGQYWWDGADWQPVDSGGGDSGTDSTSTDSGERVYSEDGQYWWDGSDWQPVQDQSVDETETTNEPEIDWSNYPLLQGIYESTSVDEWLQYIGLEPDQIKVDQ